jgi:hypothetical protein
MEQGRSYLMDECEVMASGRERSPTIIPTLAPSSCHRKQASLGANDEVRAPVYGIIHWLRVRRGHCGVTNENF